jgi:hypothetical protein
MKTGWPPGLLQDDDRKLSRWFASRPDARYQLRKHMQEDIIRMAREAGGGTTWWPLHTDTLERFAALVAAAERKRFYGQDKPAECAKGCPPKQVCDYCQVVEPVRAMILAERNTCAAIARQWDVDHPASNYGGCIANLIEAREAT